MPRKHHPTDYRISRLHRAIQETLNAVTEVRHARVPASYIKIVILLLFLGAAVFSAFRSTIEVAILTGCASALLISCVVSLMVKLSLVDTNSQRESAAIRRSAISALYRRFVVLQDHDVRRLPEEDMEGLRRLLELSTKRNALIEARLTIAILDVIPDRADSRDLPLVEALATGDDHREPVREAASLAHKRLKERIQEVAETNRLLRAASDAPEQQLLCPAGAADVDEELLLRSVNRSATSQ